MRFRKGFFAMSFFDWWLSRKKDTVTQSYPEKEKIKSQSIPIDDSFSYSEEHHYSRAPLVSTGIVINPNEFAPLLLGYLKKHSEDNEYARQRCLEALRISQKESTFISDDNRAAAIMSLIGENEALLALRAIRWKEGVFCPRCGSKNVKKTSIAHGVIQYICENCEGRKGTGNPETIFNDLTLLNIDHDMKSVIRWILISYLKMFCSIGKISKILGISPEQVTHLLSLVQQDQSFKPAKKKETKY